MRSKLCMSTSASENGTKHSSGISSMHSRCWLRSISWAYTLCSTHTQHAKVRGHRLQLHTNTHNCAGDPVLNNVTLTPSFLSTNKGVNLCSKYVTQGHQQRSESPMVTLTWHACKYKVYKPPQETMYLVAVPNRPSRLCGC